MTKDESFLLSLHEQQKRIKLGLSKSTKMCDVVVYEKGKFLQTLHSNITELRAFNYGKKAQEMLDVRVSDYIVKIIEHGVIK